MCSIWKTVHIDLAGTSVNIQAFHYLETAPLLCILDDFLEELDAVFLKYEAHSADSPQEKGSSRTSEGVRDVDGEYVELLEMCCLLQLRLLDLRHNWRNTAKIALDGHGKYAGMCVCESCDLHVHHVKVM